MKYNFYYSSQQAAAFHRINQQGGRSLMRIGRNGVNKEGGWYFRKYYNGELYTQMFPLGTKPNPRYTDWVLVGSGPLVHRRLVKELF